MTMIDPDNIDYENVNDQELAMAAVVEMACNLVPNEIVTVDFGEDAVVDKTARAVLTALVNVLAGNPEIIESLAIQYRTRRAEEAAHEKES